MAWRFGGPSAHAYSSSGGVFQGTLPSNYATSRLGAALLAGEDWQTQPALVFGKGAGNSCSDPPKNDSLTAAPPSAISQYSDAHLQYVTDPVFGLVVRGRYPYCTGDHFYHHRSLTYTASDKIWVRQVVKFQPNQYTTRGSAPTGANSHKLMFITWAGGVGARSEIEFSNTTQYIIGGSQTGKTFSETPLIGAASWGNVTTEWTGGEWWEYIMNYEIRPTDTSREPAAIGTAIMRFWKRQLTSGGAIVNNSFTFTGSWWDFTAGTPAQASGYQFFGNRNKSTDQYPDGSARPSNGSDPFYTYYGPHEVVNGSSNNNPYGLQGIGE